MINKLFEDLLNSIDPNNTMINENEKTKLVSSFQEKILEMKEQLYDDALSDVDEDHAEKLQNVISFMESMDNDHAEKLQSIVESIDEDHVYKLQEIINTIDEDHAEKFENVLSKIDEEHTNKLTQIMSKIDEDHTQKLQEIIEMYENSSVENLVESVDGFLDTYLEEIKPKETLVNEARLHKLETMFDNMKSILTVNDNYIQEEVKEAIYDAHTIIEEKDNAIDKLMLEKVQLKRQIKNIKEETNNELERYEAKKLLESKIENCSPKMSTYLKLCFKNASVNEIEEKIDEAVDAFKETEKEQRQLILENSQMGGVNPRQVKTEGLYEDKTTYSNNMNMYVNLIEKTNKKY
jgi:hypothetical protein